MTALDVACPKCGRLPGQLCVSEKGNELRGVHVARGDAARPLRAGADDGRDVRRVYDADAGELVR